MVQTQSTLFPLYDRNPQTFVPNIFHAKATDFTKATERVWHGPGEASYISYRTRNRQHDGERLSANTQLR
jgi:predicted acyl esterase